MPYQLVVTVLSLCSRSACAVTANLAALTITGGLATAEGNDYAGGGVYSSGSLDVTNCNIEGNSSPSSGGGIYNAGTMTITGCTIANNTACFDLYGGWGAGIYNSGTMTVTGSSISNNSAGQVADGVVQGSGGGIDNDGVMSLLDCQISGNVCPSNGGGYQFRHSCGLRIQHFRKSGSGDEWRRGQRSAAASALSRAPFR